MNEKKNYILKAMWNTGLIRKDQVIVVGFSGGPDSLTLLTGLHQLSEERGLGLTLVPVHVNHMIRGAAADEDQRRAEEMCREIGLRCRSFVRDCPGFAAEHGLTEEEAGRKIRYGLFLETARELEKETGRRPSIAVAHNADDQSETVLFRIIRGTGIRGLAAMAPSRDIKGYDLIRPLLAVSRSDIDAYIEEQGLEPCVDKTNFQDEYSRNHLRLTVIPDIEKNMNPGFRENLRRLADNARDDEELLEVMARDAFEKMSAADREVADLKETAGRGVACEKPASDIQIDARQFADCHRALQSRICRGIFQSLGIEEGFSRNIMGEIATVAASPSPSAELDLPGGCTVRRRYDRLIFSGASERNGIGARGEVSVSVVASPDDVPSPEKGQIIAVFDLEALKKKYPDPLSALEIRNRRPGDFMDIGSGRKKIQDMFVDMKVPREYRDQVRIVAIGSEVLWILPDERMTSGPLSKKGRFSGAYKAEPGQASVVLALVLMRVMCFTEDVSN